MGTSDRGLGGGAPSFDAAAIAGEIERLANHYFAGGAISPPRVGPSALNVGGGGASPTMVAPPVPGPMHRPPLAASPVPKESDFRAAPTLFSDNLGVSSPVALAALVSGEGSPEPAPYYLAHLAPASGAGAPSSGSLVPPGPPAGAAFPVGSFGPAAPPSPHAFPATLAPPNDAAPDDASLTAPGLASTPPANPASTPAPERTPARTLTADALDYRPELVPGLASRGTFDPNAVKRDFPILRERVHGRPLVWLDNAATTQKPQSVIDRLSFFYEHENSNVHRAAHALAARATDAYESARDKVRRLLGAPSPKQIVFVRGATEGINLVAQSWGRRNVAAGDEIVITWLEHHANIVPWQMLCAERGARLRVAPVNDRGEVILEEYEKLLGPRTRIVALTHVSNALGTIVPAREMVAMARRHGARVLVDGAQAVSHMPVDVQALDCDFYVFSGHKVFAPTGIGALYGKAEVLEAMAPWQGGGNMIADVTFEKTTYEGSPGRFEAGTGSIADAVGLGAAIDYVHAIGLENISRYEHELLVYAEGELARVPGLRMIGSAAEKAGVMSFVLDGIRTEDVGGALDQEGIAVRSGHHCAQPILRRFGLERTVRASLAPYNTREDIDALVTALCRLQAGRVSRSA